MPPITVPICRNFTAPPGATIIWTNIPPSGCTLTGAPGSGWPFKPSPPIVLPTPYGVEIKAGLAPGSYPVIATCCPKPIIVTIT